MKNKERIIVIPESVNKKLEAMPPDAREEIEAVISQLQKGEEILGDQLTLVPCTRLVCASCESEDTWWALDTNNEEVLFRCNKCEDSGWMTKAEHATAVKDNPESVIEEKEK